MKTEEKSRSRRSIRIQGYDYSQAGAYFVTICTYNHQCIFGDIEGNEVQLSQLGKIVREEWLKSFEIRKEIELDYWAIMPNHFHAIVLINNDMAESRGDRPVAPTVPGAAAGGIGGQPVIPTVPEPSAGSRGDRPVAPTAPRPAGPKGRSLSSLMAGFKSAVTTRINILRGTRGAPVWQRNYYEHVIRDEESLNRIREYINYNPLNWALDRENPHRGGEDPFDRWMRSFHTKPDRIVGATGKSPLLRSPANVNPSKAGGSS